jgi:hypothetical protein
VIDDFIDRIMVDPEGVHQRKHCHNRLKVLLHILEDLN